MIASHRIKVTRFSLSLLIFILILTDLHAQENQDSLKVELKEIEITAIHTSISEADAPLSLSTISRTWESINNEAALSLQNIGEHMPGLWVNDRQNYALGERLTIRGMGWRAAFGVRGVQVVLNDMPLTVADGQTMMNIVEPAFIRRAELVRGPAAAYWGNSSGGILYLSTRPDFDDPYSFRIRTMGGSYGTRKAEAEFSFSNSIHQMSGYSSYLSTNGFRNYSAAKVLRSGVTGSIKLTSKSQLKYQAASLYMPKAQHPSSLTADQMQNNPTMAIPSYIDAEAGKQVTQGQAGLTYTLDTPAGILDVTGYSIYRDLNNPLPFGIITINRWAGGLRTTLDKSWEKLDLQIGLESKLQNDDRTEFENLGDAQRGAATVDQIERVWNQALFATATYAIDRFNILGSLRYDRLRFKTDAPQPSLSGSRIFQSASPSVGISYQPANQTFFLNFSTSFEAPTTTELVNRPGGGNGFNPDLKPEKTLGLETGIRGSSDAQTIHYDLALYRLWIQDLLFPYQLEPNGPTFYRNQGETTHSGIEAHIIWQPAQNWEVSAIANISEAEFQQAQTLDSLSLAGKEVPGIPRYRINGELGWSPRNFSLSLSYKFVSSYPVNNLNTAENERYGVIDAEFSYHKTFSNPRVQIYPFININNLLNSRYSGSVSINASGARYFEPSPGRNLHVGISVNF